MGTIHQLTHRIIGCAMNVHNELGTGFQEKIYHRALEIEFNLNGLSFESEKTMEIYYKGIKIGTRRANFFVENKVMVEIKTLTELIPTNKAQTINYCEAYNTPHGLLINFGESKLVFHRVYNKRLVDPSEPLEKF